MPEPESRPGPQPQAQSLAPRPGYPIPKDSRNCLPGETYTRRRGLPWGRKARQLRRLSWPAPRAGRGSRHWAGARAHFRMKPTKQMQDSTIRQRYVFASKLLFAQFRLMSRQWVPPLAIFERRDSGRWYQAALLRGAGQILTGLHERIHVSLINQARSGIHEAWDRRKTVFGPIRVERWRLVVIEIVEHLQSDEGHGIGLLRDRGRDDAFLDPL